MAKTQKAKDHSILGNSEYCRQQ